MTARRAPRPVDDNPALTRFVQLNAEILRLLATLTEANNDHLGVGPDEVNWGHVGSAEFIRERLADAVAQLPRA